MEIDIRGLSTVLKKHQETGLCEQGRHWAVSRGGYDLNWQAYYNNSPMVECVNNDVNGGDVALLCEVNDDRAWDSATITTEDAMKIFKVIKDTYPDVEIPNEYSEEKEEVER
jgi:hypothetical protein